jgi:hypothetical protein
MSPRIIGSRVKLNPVWLMFALFAFGYLFGFVGLLVAIPLAASLGVILRFAMRKSLPSSNLAAVPPPSATTPLGPLAEGHARSGELQTVSRDRSTISIGQGKLDPPGSG